MKAIETLFPVFFMIVLGMICKKKKWVSSEQKDGVKRLIFNVLLPILIFNALFTSKINYSTLWIVIYVISAFLIAYAIGKLLGNWTGKRFAHISPYMLMTCEGGSVALPLYVSIVGSGYIINTVTFDIAGIITGFIIIPIMVAKQAANEIDIISLVKKTFSNSFVIALVLGIGLNTLGLYNFINQSFVSDIYTNTLAMATSSITSLILFMIGFEFKLNAIILKPLIKFTLLRIITSIGIIAGFFFLFPELIAEKTYLIAVLVYYMCPTGFATPLQLAPIHKDEMDESYLSTSLSFYMIITLFVYTLVVSFIV